MKKSQLKILILVTLGVFLVPPMVLSEMMHIKFFSSALGSADGWLSYWGSYSGGIFGIIGVLGTTYFIIKNQNEQHRELLNRQREEIEETAKVNDKQERERTYHSFLIRQNEQIIVGLLKLKRLLQLREGVLYSIWEIYNEHLIIRDLMELSGPELPLFNSMDNTAKKLLEDVLAGKREDTQIISDIVEVIGEIQVKSIYIEVEIKSLVEFTNYLEMNFKEMSELINKKQFDQGYINILDNYVKNKNNYIQELIDLYSYELRLLINKHFIS